MGFGLRFRSANKLKNVRKTVKSCYLIECSAPHWIDVGRRIIDAGHEIKRWTAWNISASKIAAEVPSAIFHDTIFCKTLKDELGRNVELGGLNDAALSVLREDQSMILDMMSRFDHSRDLHHSERSSLLISYLSYWENVLCREAPDLVIFSAPPHVVYDFVILALCRKLDLKTLMFEEATICPPYCLEMKDFLEGSPDLAEAARKSYPISDETKAIVARLNGDYKLAKPEREVVATRDKDDAYAQGLDFLFYQRDALKIAEDEARKNGVAVESVVNSTSLVKERGVHLTKSFLSPYSNSRFTDQRIREFVRSMELKAYYERVCATEDNFLGRKYVYVPLAGQPERTSNPQAGEFMNQIAMVATLAGAIPNDWLIVVKEHPNQFHPNFAVNMYRSEVFYDTLLSLPQVRLCKTECDAFKLIDNSTAVATTGGTASLEAAAREKPSLLFGHAWYQSCPQIRFISTAKEARAAFSEISTGNSLVDRNGFANYLEAVRSSCFRGLGDSFPPDYPISENENSEALWRVVSKFLAS